MTLTTFLLARIAEDEALARLEVGRRDVILRGPFDPARILAECEAKRRIVGRYHASTTAASAIALLPVLRDLASPYAAHEDFEEEWRP